MSGGAQASQLATRRHADAGWPYAQPSGVGPGGRPFCRWCWAEVPKGRSSWCSAACVDEYRRLHDWNYIRRAVLARDGGVCACCGVDTEWLAGVCFHRSKVHPEYAEFVLGRGRETLTFRLLGTEDHNRQPWEADHMHARSEGGTDHPSNLRTLCIPCHKRRTAAQQAEWAARRRDEASVLFVEGVA